MSEPNKSAEALVSRQIAIARVVCITLMFSVHVNPGLSSDSVVSGGTFSLTGAIIGGWFGRASVAALSFFSGYVMLSALERGDLGAFARRRFATLIVPMLTWNLLYIAARAAAQSAEAGWGWPDFALPWLSAEAVGLTGPTENLSLFFLRDLFVAGCLGFVLAPAVRRAPATVLCGAILLALFDPVAPLLFRPTILLFLLAGMAVALHRVNIARLSRAAIALPLGLGAAGLSLCVSPLVAEAAADPLAAAAGLGVADLAANLANILKRVALVFLVFLVTRRIAQSRICGAVLRLEAGMFTSYLSHLIVVGIAWRLWGLLVGDEHDESYLLFFLLAPLVALGVGQWVDLMLRRSPAPLQRVLRGRVAPGHVRSRIAAIGE